MKGWGVGGLPYRLGGWKDRQCIMIPPQPEVQETMHLQIQTQNLWCPTAVINARILLEEIVVLRIVSAHLKQQHNQDHGVWASAGRC